MRVRVRIRVLGLGLALEIALALALALGFGVRVSWVMPGAAFLPLFLANSILTCRPPSRGRARVGARGTLRAKIRVGVGVGVWEKVQG